MNHSANWTEVLGFVAAACTTLAFVPQLIKIRKQGGRDLSYLMLSTYLFGLVLWLIYGLRLHAPAVIAANIVGLILVGSALVMKIVMDPRENRKVSDGSERVQTRSVTPSDPCAAQAER